MCKAWKFSEKLLFVLAAGILVVAGCKARSTAGGIDSSPRAAELAKTWPEFKTPHKVEIQCFEMGWSGPAAEKDFVTPEIFQRTNFQLDYKSLTVSTGDELNQKLNLMVASRDVPLIYLGGGDDFSVSIYEKMGQAGLIWDLTEPVKKYNSIYTLVKPELLKYVSKIDGKNYFVPTQTGRGFDFLNGAPGGLYVRDDFLKRLGLDYPKTYRELYTYLKRSRDEIKTVAGQPVIGYTCGESFASLDTLVVGFYGIYAGPRTNGFAFDAKNNYKIVNETFAGGAANMNMAKYLNRLFREGLIDKEILTHKNVQYEEKLSSGRVAAMGANGWWIMNTNSDNAKAVVPEHMFVTPPDLVDDEHGTPSRLDKWTYQISMPSTLTVSKKLDEGTLKHFLALLDYLATVDGQLLVNWGVEGRSYTVNDAGKAAFTEQFKTETDGLDWNKAASYGVYYWQQVVQNSIVLNPFIAEFPELVREDNRKGWVNKQGQRDLFDPNLPLTKSLFYTLGEVEQELMPALDDAYIQFLVKVFQAKSEADVEKVVSDWGATCKELGIDKIIAEREARIQKIQI